jgi:hypothetical protein
MAQYGTMWHNVAQYTSAGEMLARNKKDKEIKIFFPKPKYETEFCCADQAHKGWSKEAQMVFTTC